MGSEHQKKMPRGCDVEGVPLFFTAFSFRDVDVGLDQGGQPQCSETSYVLRSDSVEIVKLVPCTFWRQPRLDSAGPFRRREKKKMVQK
jgi:hypothetical protein